MPPFSTPTLLFFSAEMRAFVHNGVFLIRAFPEHLSVFSLCVVLGLEQGGLFFQLVGSGRQPVHVQVLEGQR